jgi:hypothetical protein
MRQRIDLASLYARALNELKDTRFDDVSPRPWPAACPVGLDEMLNEDRGMLEERFTTAAGTDQH